MLAYSTLPAIPFTDTPLIIGRDSPRPTATATSTIEEAGIRWLVSRFSASPSLYSTFPASPGSLPLLLLLRLPSTPSHPHPSAPSQRLVDGLSFASPSTLPSRPSDPENFVEHGRSHDCAESVPTASHASRPAPVSTQSASLDAPAVSPVLAVPSPSLQPDYPEPSIRIPSSSNPATPQPSTPSGGQLPNLNRTPPFRNLLNQHQRHPPRHPASGPRLWNPINSTPRSKNRKRRPSTPPPPSIPLQHPSLNDRQAAFGPVNSQTGEHPLLSVPEQRQTRHSLGTHESLQAERSVSSDRRISLPPSVRASIDGKPSKTPSPTSPVQDQHTFNTAPKLDKGKGKAIMSPDNEETGRSYSRDLERGPDALDPRPSNVSMVDGIGSALSSTNSSIMGEDVQGDLGDEWGPQHPCYPHLNPHVPVESAEYVTTRIIRIRRDWLLKGDLAPTFSNLYPEILDPAGLSEQEFRRIIEKLNGELVPIFDPWSFRNILDGMLGLVTGWVWDDMGLTYIKTRLNGLEKWIEEWNSKMEKTATSEEGVAAPKLMSLRRTGYMTLDIQIPDPEIAPAPSTQAGDSHTALPMEPGPVLAA